MKLGTPFLALGILLALAGIPFAITAASCSDGTAYGKCSSANPGNYCTGDINGPALQMYPALCKCEAVAGWVQQGTGVDATCVQAKCDDGSKAGDCATTKPKVCLGGANYADNATKCGCPQGKKISANGIFCESIPCNDSGFSVPEGTCSPKKGKKCVNGALVDKASECKCPTGQTAVGETCALLCSDGTKDGSCAAVKPKKCVNGLLIEDAASCGCPEGQKAVGKQCASASIFEIGGSDVLGGAPANNSSGTGTGTSALSCCCLPTALIGLAGGFAVFRKK